MENKAYPQKQAMLIYYYYVFNMKDKKIERQNPAGKCFFFLHPVTAGRDPSSKI